MKQLLKEHALKGNKITKIQVGFTNDIFSVDEQYIIKICKDRHNEPSFRREAELYQHFYPKLPVPHLKIYDDTKSLLDKDFMIYDKIKGDNLYNVWHQLTNELRRDLVRQLCAILKTINRADLQSLPVNIGLKEGVNWSQTVMSRLTKSLAVAQSMQTLSIDEIKRLQEFLNAHRSCLDEQKIALVYWDAHFDNVLVRDHKVVGLLDFERTELASIDFVFHLVYRMFKLPKWYMSEYAEQFAQAADYQYLMDWCEEFYPELFDFADIQTRIKLYSITADLENLKRWPHVKMLKNNILDAIA